MRISAFPFLESRLCYLKKIISQNMEVYVLKFSLEKKTGLIRIQFTFLTATCIQTESGYIHRSLND